MGDAKLADTGGDARGESLYGEREAEDARSVPERTRLEEILGFPPTPIANLD